MLCKRTSANQRRGSHQDECIRANKFEFAFKFERLDEGGLGLIGDPRQG